MVKSQTRPAQVGEPLLSEPLRVAIGSDMVGYRLKEQLVAVLREDRHTVKDHGAHQNETLELATAAERVGTAVLQGDADVGVLVASCGAAAGMIANKIIGVRAAHCGDTFTSRQARAQYDANVLGIGARVVGDDLAAEIARAFLGSRFSGDERDLRRVADISRLEDQLTDELRPARLRRD